MALAVYLETPVGNLTAQIPAKLLQTGPFRLHAGLFFQNHKAPAKDNRRKRRRKDQGTHGVDQVITGKSVHNRIRACRSKCLAKRTHNDIDPFMLPLVFSQSQTEFAERSRPVSFIDDQHGVIRVPQLNKLFEIRTIPIHAEHRFRNDKNLPVALTRPLEEGFKMLVVQVPVTSQLGTRNRRTVIDAGMIEPV